MAISGGDAAGIGGILSTIGGFVTSSKKNKLRLPGAPSLETLTNNAIKARSSVLRSLPEDIRLQQEAAPQFAGFKEQALEGGGRLADRLLSNNRTQDFQLARIQEEARASGAARGVALSPQNIFTRGSQIGLSSLQFQDQQQAQGVNLAQQLAGFSAATPFGVSIPTIGGLIGQGQQAFGQQAQLQTLGSQFKVGQQQARDSAISSGFGKLASGFGGATGIGGGAGGFEGFLQGSGIASTETDISKLLKVLQQGSSSVGSLGSSNSQVGVHTG